MNDKRPALFRIALLASGAVIVVMLAVSTYAWFRIPPGTEVCVHWNAAGACDGYGGRFEGLFLMPIIVAAVVGLFAVIPSIEPRRGHILQSAGAYVAVWMVMLLYFLAFHIILTLSVLGHKVAIGSLVPFIVGLMFVVVGAFLGRVKSNFLFGIRTPWTLSSELSWRKTHRLGGWLFIVEGVLVAVGAIAFPGTLWVYLLMGSIVVLLVTVTVYSYVVWKGDPNRTPGGTPSP